MSQHLKSDLFLEVQPAGGEAFERSLRDGEALGIGRGESNELHLEDGSLSRRHARLSIAGGIVFFEDLGSRNGSLVNGDPVLERRELLPGDRVQVAGSTILLRKRSPVQIAPSLAGSAARVAFEIAPLLRDRRKSSSRERQLFVDVAAANRALDLVARVSELFIEHRTVPAILDSVLELVLAGLDGQRAAIALVDSDGARPEVFAARDEAGPTTLELSRTVSRRVLQERTAVSVVDLRRDPELSTADSLRLLPIRSLMCAPLWDGSEVRGYLYVDRPNGAGDFTENDLEVLNVIANLVAAQVEGARRFEKEREAERRRGEAGAVRALQRDLLPDWDARFEGVHVHGTSRPCAELAGDFFDHFPVPSGAHGLVVVDIGSRGLRAASLGGGLRAALRAGLSLDEGLSHRAAWLSAFVREHWPEREPVTMVYVELAPGGRSFTYLSAGRAALLLLRRDGRTELLVEGGPPLGQRADAEYRPGEAILEAGDRLVLASDGLVDAVGGAGAARFGVEGISRALGRAAPGADAEDACAAVLAEFRTFLGTVAPQDDATVLCAVREG